ncbi:MAG TPA: hypothetical protein VNC79_04865, partial [Mycobacteriales bacterium]|nr:hypothetical protein [Mycobacteriales bacterium]
MVGGAGVVGGAVVVTSGGGTTDRDGTVTDGSVGRLAGVDGVGSTLPGRSEGNETPPPPPPQPASARPTAVAARS